MFKIEIMKKFAVVALLTPLCLFLTFSCFAQSKIEVLDFDKDLPFEAKKNSDKTKRPILDKMDNALQSMDLEQIEKLLTSNSDIYFANLKDELDEKFKLISAHDSIQFYGTKINEGSRGNFGLAKFWYSSEDTNNKLNIRYVYNFVGEDMKIVFKDILIFEDDELVFSAPSKYFELNRIMFTEEEESAKIEIQKNRTILNSLAILHENGETYFDDDNDFLSQTYGNISWYYALENMPEKTIIAASKGLKLNPKANWIKINLLNAYAMLGKMKEAYDIIDNNINDDTDIGTFKEVSLSDLDELKKYISPYNYDLLVQRINDKSIASK